MRWMAFGLLLLLGACAGSPREPAPEASAPEAAPPPAAAAKPEKRSIPAEPTLADVLRLAADTPALRAARAAVARDRGLARQADVGPNPTAMLMGERIPLDDLGDGPARYKAGVTQRIETAGKRDARIEVATETMRESEAAVDAEERRVAVSAAKLHQRALHTTLRLATWRTVVEAHEEKLALLRSQVDAGRRMAHALHPVQSRLGLLRVHLAKDSEEMEVALRDLEAVLAVPAGTFTGVSLVAPPAPALPDADAEETRTLIAETHPDLVALRSAATRARSGERLARAGAWPDVTLGLELASGENMMGEREETVGVSVAWPLPVSDRNRGAIAAARAETGRRREQLADATASLIGRYASLLESIRARRTIVAEYRDTILPALQQHLEAATAAFEGGRTDRTDVLDARISLAEAVDAMIHVEGELAEMTIEALGILGRRFE